MLPFDAAAVEAAPTGSKFTAAEAQQLVELHNGARKEVGVEPVEWSPKLAQEAQKWCDQLVAKDAFDHSWGDYGENLARGASLTDAFALWLSEKARYHGQAIDGVNTSKIGHYTQIVWKDTKRIGCGKGKVSKGLIWVCYYDPPGNWKGEKPY